MPSAKASEANARFSRCTIDATFPMAEFRPASTLRDFAFESRPSFNFFKSKSGNSALAAATYAPEFIEDKGKPASEARNDQG